MNKEEVAKFAYKLAAHNERTIVTLKDKTEYKGHFFNNTKFIDKTDNKWNFVIPSNGEENPLPVALNGDEIETIKKIQLF